ncbi:MAG: VPLPA-CTERM sorting domain-containing protein [Syntrophaceae bacterium]|nr:VPLPA-CTERM sorting domain-containing protein [Syntrophaceae bacterium]
MRIERRENVIFTLSAPDTPNTVPIPGAFWLLGAGLLGLAALRRRFK